MGRSPVLAGRIDARDRAHQRHRLDRARPDQVDPPAAIHAWLVAAPLPLGRPEAVARLDLDRFLASTSGIALAPEERLRQLAIFLESHGRADGAWLDRIYEAALRLAPDDALVWHSRSITAKQTSLASRGARASRWRARARRALDRANELAPDDVHVRYSLGKWAYFLGRGAEEALPLFERALDVAPRDGWALLYRAHCLHDLGRWDEAVRAYDAVRLDTFEGNHAWLVDVVLEDVSYCRLQAGDEPGALAGFERLLTRLERDPQRAFAMPLPFLRRAANGALREQLGTRVEAFLARSVPVPRDSR